MSILSSLVKIAYDYIISDDSASKPATISSDSKTDNKPAQKTKNNTTNPNSSFRPKDETIGGIGDSLKIKSKQIKTKAKSIITEKSVVDKKIKSIHQKIKANKLLKGESAEDFYNKVLKGMNFKTFIYKSTNEQLKILDEIDASINRYIEIKKHGVSKNADAASIVSESAKNAMEAKQKGIISDSQELSSTEVGDAVEDLGKDFESLSKTDKLKRVELAGQKWFKEQEAKIDEEAEKYCKTEEEKIKYKKHAKQRLKYMARERQLQILETKPSDIAAKSVVMLQSEDMDYGIKTVLTTRNSKQEKINVADNIMSVEYVKDLLKSYYDRGETPPKEVLQAANQVLVAAKSYEGTQKFEREFYQFRLDCETNGIPDYMSQEQLTAMSTGIGTGISFNENMTTEQKVQCLHSWDEHQRNFSDYETVKNEYNNAIKQYIQEHPEAKEGIEELYTKYKMQYGKTPDEPSTPKASQAKENDTEENTNTNYQQTQIISDISDSPSTRNDKKENTIEVNNPVKATPEQLKKALLTMKYDDVRKQFKKNNDREFAEVIIHNSKLKGLWHNIIGTLKAQSPEDINNIIDGCSTEAFLFVLRNLDPVKAGHLYDLSKLNKCYNARKLGEKIIEESKRNEAA